MLQEFESPPKHYIDVKIKYWLIISYFIMKKLLFVVLLIGCMSCSNTQNTPVDSVDTDSIAADTVVVDSIVTDSTTVL